MRLIYPENLLLKNIIFDYHNTMIIKNINIKIKHFIEIEIKMHLQDKYFI